MVCKPSDPNDCCGDVAYASECRKCRTVVRPLMFLVRIAGAQERVRFRAMTLAERQEYRRPAFFGDEGCVITGIGPVGKRLVLELLWPLLHRLAPQRVIHGTKLVPKAWLNTVMGAHCWLCNCRWGRHCVNCFEGYSRDPRVDTPSPFVAGCTFGDDVLAPRLPKFDNNDPLWEYA